MGRNASGVKAITLSGPKDEVIGMICVSDPKTVNVLVVSEKGYGKRSEVEEYRITNRGGKGVKTISITDKTGDLIAIKEVVDSDHLMIINKSGIAIRISVSEMRVMGRATQGVRLINLKDTDSIAAVAKIDVDEEAEAAAAAAAEAAANAEGAVNGDVNPESNGVAGETTENNENPVE
jgi:DNA gyrase subunit A